MRPRKYEHLARQISADYKGGSKEPLPSVAVLASRYDVSYVTMWKAIRHARQQGLLHSGKPKNVAPRRIYEKIKAAILEGDYRRGRPLPKQVYLAGTYHVSAHTIIAALRRLANEDLVHKKGKRWIAGPPHPARKAAGFADSSNPVVLLVLPNEYDWYRIDSSDIRAQFTIPFAQEMDRYGFQLELAREIGDREITRAELKAQLSRTMKRVRALGRRYAGTLFIYFQQSRTGVIFHEWVEQLLRYKKPVVFFDFANQWPQFTRGYVHNYRHYYRLYQDESQALHLALSTLENNGHRRIGYPDCGDGSWIRHRFEHLLAIARTRSADIKCATALPAHGRSLVEHTYQTAHAALTRRFETLYQKRVSRHFIGLLYNCICSLTALCEKHKPTAIIAPNDVFGREMHFWLEQIGISIPSDLSLISFDNLPFSVAFPISTIDFGFGKLAYLAAHALIGDIPVRADRKGQIGGTCTIAHRGSVGRLAGSGV
ncbi:MAG: GntR family transcriptional regulator [Chitinivibrionales bacterium]|nr:GntR family transcriptional regulator [Chitinivibrionales bacterium]